MLFENEQAVKADNEKVDGKIWYIPHHGIYHPRKPDKISVVFDCSAKFKDVSLNQVLLQGPDLTNHLVGVLIRFRQEQVGIVGDLEKIFHQVQVAPRFPAISLVA